ncbi:(S)-coclaurine N-methyltransferase [Selaginella moellendorffii]|uniref:(S)-coclaurine N-methyltransferase n=1 Tax=Selaginella moellendorffii TaxID=88036 RepID=UPI000D1C35E1|nr:(S)-coclaurine N-methyltransferase [Selaginella moellendorffii]|eukprot:XP_024531246.1 (S)-coclaurine N-methyltransferase [Selaginella moellendorffii]
MALSTILVKPEQLDEAALRNAARDVLSATLTRFTSLPADAQLTQLLEFVESLKEMPLALPSQPEFDAYELPTEFFEIILGKRLKFGALYFKNFEPIALDEAEDAMLELYFERARIQDGQTILDIGAGWGAASFYIAERCPRSHITAVCSKLQKDYIDNKCRELGISNVRAIESDICTLELNETFDRVLCIELLEYLKNYKLLFEKISSWMTPDGLLFIEALTHKSFARHYQETQGDEMTAWIGKYFLNGGTLLADSLLLNFQDDLSIVGHWRIDGRHHGLSSDAYARQMSENADLIRPIFNDVYGKEQANVWMGRWKAVFILFAEMYKFDNGQQWLLSHYLFKKN